MVKSQQKVNRSFMNKANVLFVILEIVIHRKYRTKLGKIVLEEFYFVSAIYHNQK